MPTNRLDAWLSVTIALVLLLVYNANGREIGSYDSQATKFAAHELLLRRTLTLNHVVGAIPEYAERPAFVLCLDGRYRSGYSPVPAIAAAVIAYPAVRAGLIDPGAASAPAVIVVLAASVLTALAVALLYLAARRHAPRDRSLALAAGLGLGTGLWPLVSRTMWEHETAIFGLAVAVFFFASAGDRLRPRDAVGAAAGLALAGLARPQLAPMIAVLLAGICLRTSRGAALGAAAIVIGSGAALMLLYWRWFGHPFGAQVLFQAKVDSWHRTKGFVASNLEGFAGLLISPSRGLLVFSPIVVMALAGFRDAARARWTSPLRWCAAAALVQFVVYSSYAVWWAGHTYGPRYMLDLLPVLVLPAASAMARMHFGGLRGAAWSAALAWSLVLAATGAFCYPYEAWNTSPVEVDLEHSRLWDWSDPQFLRCWRTGLSPQNFELFDRRR